ncbi:MAG TPA: hypothetical protein VLA11_05385, partial [Woeseiaceae bacterium]|nr:hypothetical protein [Woeseiaceae bacterium]
MSTRQLTSKPTIRLFLCLCAALAASATGLAQENGEDVLEEIIVTATRIESDLMSTPIAVSAFTQEQLTRDGIKDIR